MTLIQKLAIGSGIATSLAVIVCSIIFIDFASNQEIPGAAVRSTVLLLLCCQCSLLIAISAYYNATQQSTLALWVLFVGCFVIVFVVGFVGFFFFIWGGFLLSLLFFITAVLAIVTMFLAP